MGRSGCLTKVEYLGYSCKQTFELSSFAEYDTHQKIESLCPSPDNKPPIRKKDISNNFYTSFTKHFACEIHFQLHNHDLFKKIRCNQIPYVMLILINRYLLNIFFSMTKILNGQRSPKQNFYSPPLSILFRNPCFS